MNMRVMLRRPSASLRASDGEASAAHWRRGSAYLRRGSAHWRRGSFAALRMTAVFAVIIAAYGCTSTTSPSQTPAQLPQQEHGLASWYGQEFAGRTTANGEIFDPMLLTAAHRTLPFGTIVDVKNPKTGQTARVRINDRGPYIANRVIDLSYAAAQQIGLTDNPNGEVDLNVVHVGNGEREPPAPFVVTIPDVPQPAVGGPAPTPAPVPAPVPAVPVTVENVQVVEEHHGVETRRQVAPGGKTVEVVPVKPAPPQPAPPQPVTPKPQPAPATAPATPRVSTTGKYVVQVGAFSVEANAKALQERLAKIGQSAFVDHKSLYRVRIGPFETREQAMQARARLESSGISAIIVPASS